jgi:LPS-assembly protein
MRDARTSRANAGFARGFGRAQLLALIVAATCLLAGTPAARAQDPSLASRTGNPSSSSFPKQPGGILGGPVRKLDKAQPIYLQGDELIYDNNRNRVIARGNVEIYFNDYILTADQVIYDQSANTLTAEGNAQLKEPNGNIVRADKLVTSDDFRDAFVQSLSVVAKDDTRIAAQRAVRREGNVTEFEQGKFTPCKNDPGKPPLWCISAARIVHDQQAATISYTDAQFELFGVPIFYLPYFSHPDPSVKRRSGFLTPEIGNSTTLGFMSEIPYYFALAPNYDFTFHPMYTSKHGVLWMGDWRHRVSFGDIRGQYSFKFAGIDQDASTLDDIDPARRDRLDGWRGSVETKGLFSLSSWWRFGWDITLESDDTFRRFYKLDNMLLTDRVNKVFLAGLSDRNYFGLELYQFGGLMFTDTPETESRAHPIMDYNYVFADPILGGELTWSTNALSFSSEQDPTTFAPLVGGTEQMNRIVTEVNWRRRFTDPLGITYTPFGQLRGDIYEIKDYVDPTDPQGGTFDTSLARGLAVGGITVAYPWVANAAYGSHVIEPIGQIIARQNTIDQDALPNEDAQSLVFDDTNLFEVTKFSGYDRIETGTRANVGLQYTFQANDGGYARILAGESYHLAGVNPYADPGLDANGNPVFSPFSGLQNDRSDYVLGAYIAPWTFLQLISQSRFEQNDFDLRRQDAGAQITAGPFAANATYAYLASDLTNGIATPQEDIYSSLTIKLTDRWSVAGAMRYDIDADEIASDMFQVRYGDECFVLTATYTDNYYHNPDIVDGQTVMLRFELKHLGEFGYATDALSGTSITEQQSGG